MSMTIWKYALPIEYGAILSMPKGAVILTAQAQGGRPYIWAQVDDEAPEVYHKILVIGTGHELEGPTFGKYIGSIHLHDGQFVFHVFDMGEE